MKLRLVTGRGCLGGVGSRPHYPWEGLLLHPALQREAQAPACWASFGGPRIRDRNKQCPLGLSLSISCETELASDRSGACAQTLLY